MGSSISQLCNIPSTREYPDKFKQIINKLPVDTQNNKLIIAWFRKCFKRVNYIEKIIMELNKDEILIDSFEWYPDNTYENLHINIKIFSLVRDIEYTLSVVINIKYDSRHALLII